MSRALLFLVAAALIAAVLPTAAPASAGSGSQQEQFTASIKRLSAARRHAMTPSVWRRGCPVKLRQLRLVRVSHWDFTGGVSRGRLVVHRDAAPAVVEMMSGLFELEFPIRRMVPIRRYGGDDFDSIEADNTSAFNCRRATGSRNWSRHAYGRAIDINPLENPYVNRGRTVHAASRKFLDRRSARPGMLVEGSPEVAVVDAAGWEWGGRWRQPKDYQHITAPPG